MGYGGGAMIGAPLAVWLMGHYARNDIPGVSWALASMGVIYFFVMCAGALGFRVAPSGCGARPLKRVIQRYVQDPLAEMILAGDVRDGSTVKISAGKEGLTFNGKTPAAAEEEEEEDEVESV